MRDWSLLSDEILNNIFVYLYTVDRFANKHLLQIKQCALTCREWRVAAQSIFFFKICIKTMNHMEEIQRVVSANKMIGDYVKRLKIHPEVNNINILLTVDTLFPKLEELDIDHWQPLIYELFSKMLIERNKFRNLKDIPKPSTGQQCDMYLKCLDYMKSRITSIVLWEGDSSEHQNSYLDLRNKLNQFSSLEKILLGACSQTKSQSITKYLDSLTNCSPASLKQITLGFHDTAKLFFSSKKPNTIQPTNNLRNLFLKVFLYSHYSVISTPDDQFLIYLVKKFPKLYFFKFENSVQCKTWHTINDNNFSHDHHYNSSENRNVKAQSVDAIHQFLIYLCSRPNTQVSDVIISNDNTSKIIYKLYTAVDMPSVPVSSHCLQIKYKTVWSFNYISSINTCIDFESQYLRTRKITVVFYKKEGDNYDYKQQYELTKRVGNFFDAVCLQAASNTAFALILNHISKYCPNVNDLAIYKETLEGNPFEKQEKVPSEGLGVTRLIINEFAPSVEQFPYISLCLPFLKTLVLDKCFEQIATKEGSSFSISIPNSSLRNMKIVLLYFEENLLQEIFFKVTTEEAPQKARYCHLVRTKLEYKSSFYYDFVSNRGESDYKRFVLNENVTTCHIHCKSLENFTVVRYDNSLDDHVTI